MTQQSESRETLPVRRRTTRSSGRHRGPDEFAFAPHRPALILAVPGSVATPSAASSLAVSPPVAEEIADRIRPRYPDIAVRLGHLEDEQESLAEVLPEVADGSENDLAAVVVPLLTGPNTRLDAEIDETIARSGVTAARTDPLGPDPLLAEALHIRLAERGLVRADRIRRLGIATGVDGVIVAVLGGEAAVREGDVTGVLLASRLAVPVVCACLDGAPSVTDVVERLRASGARRIGVAPCVIGTEIDADVLTKLADETDVECAEPLGAALNIVRLVTARYEDAVGEPHVVS